MAITRMSNLGIASLGSEKYNDMLAGLPGVMPAPTAADGGTGTSATVSFTAVSGATSYIAISNPGNLTGTASSSPVTVSGLTTGTAYTFRIASINSVGQGGYSAASNSVTPAVPTDYESIVSFVATGSSNTITFSSIPGTYSHLQIRAITKNTSAGSGLSAYDMRINSDSALNYPYHRIFANGSSILSQGYNAGSGSNGVYLAPLTTAGLTNIYGAAIIDIHDYASTTKRKTVRSFLGADYNGNGQVILTSSVWLNSNAINALSFVSASGNWASGTTIALYGIK